MEPPEGTAPEQVLNPAPKGFFVTAYWPIGYRALTRIGPRGARRAGARVPCAGSGTRISGDGNRPAEEPPCAQRPVKLQLVGNKFVRNLQVVRRGRRQSN